MTTHGKVNSIDCDGTESPQRGYRIQCGSDMARLTSCAALETCQSQVWIAGRQPGLSTYCPSSQRPTEDTHLTGRNTWQRRTRRLKNAQQDRPLAIPLLNVWDRDDRP